MTQRRLRSFTACAIVGVAILTTGCSGEASPQGGSASGGSSGKGATVAGERLTVRQIVDPMQGGLVVGVVAVPEKWTYESTVTWNYEHVSNPVALSATAQNPGNAEALFSFPNQQFFDLRPSTQYLRQGQMQGGLIYLHPENAVPALAAFVQRTRGSLPKFAFVGSKSLPDLPAALRMPPAKNQEGVGVKVTYELNGIPVEEEFYAVWYALEIPYDGPQGRTYQINWGLLAPHSFRAPAGTIDARRPVFAAIAKSFRPNPAWQERSAAVNKYLTDQFNAQMRAGYDAIAAAGRLSRQISANNDAMIASIDQSLRSSSTASTSAGRSAVDKFSDYVRGVDTTDDPYYGSSQHSSNEQFHWTDGYGNYRNANDATYDPNRSEVGNWTMMKSIR